MSTSRAPITATGTTRTTASAATTTASASLDLTPSFVPSYWQGQSSYGTASFTPRQSWNNPASTFYPSFLNPLNRNPTSPPGSDTISLYDMNRLPLFQQPLSIPSIGNILTAGPKHQHSNAMVTAQNALPNQASAPPLPSYNPYMVNSSSILAYGELEQLSTSPCGRPSFGGQLGIGIPPPGRMTSNSHLSHHRLGYYPIQPWSSYSVPAMNGPVMPNACKQGSQISLVGSLQPGISPGLNSGNLANMQQVNGRHPPHPEHVPRLTNDRPFKCNGCSQSFNRNHDLKRHKRIHLAVRPFPCTRCDKSFSRKDALRRHFLVKNCGEKEPPKRTPPNIIVALSKKKTDLESNSHI